jgi:hypothetical protein
LITTAEGMPIVWGLANPKIGEREAVEAPLALEHAATPGEPRR